MVGIVVDGTVLGVENGPGAVKAGLAAELPQSVTAGPVPGILTAGVVLPGGTICPLDC